MRGEDKILTGRVPFQCQQNPDGVSIPNTYIPPNQCLLPHINTYIHCRCKIYDISHVCDKVVAMKAHLGLTYNSGNIVKDLPASSGPFPVKQDTKIPLFRAQGHLTASHTPQSFELYWCLCVVFPKYFVRFVKCCKTSTLELL